MTKEELNKEVDVQGLTSNAESTETGAMSNAQVDNKITIIK